MSLTDKARELGQELTQWGGTGLWTKGRGLDKILATLISVQDDALEGAQRVCPDCKGTGFVMKRYVIPGEEVTRDCLHCFAIRALTYKEAGDE